MERASTVESVFSEPEILPVSKRSRRELLLHFNIAFSFFTVRTTLTESPISFPYLSVLCSRPPRAYLHHDTPSDRHLQPLHALGYVHVSTHNLFHTHLIPYIWSSNYRRRTFCQRYQRSRCPSKLHPAGDSSREWES